MTDSNIRVDRPSITVTVSNGSHIVFKKTFQKSHINLGRSADSDICLTDFTYVSRRHLTLHLLKDSVKVIDEGSKVGTLYLGDKVSSVEINSHGIFQIINLKISVLFNPVLKTEISKVPVEFDKLELTATSDLMTKIRFQLETEDNAKGAAVAALGKASKKNVSNPITKVTEPPASNTKVLRPLAASPSTRAKVSVPRVEPAVTRTMAPGVGAQPPASPENPIFFSSKLGPYSSRLALRTTLIWDGQVLSSSIVQNNEPIIVSGREGEGLYLPSENLGAQNIGYVQNNVANLFLSNSANLIFSKNYDIPKDIKFEAERGATSGMFPLKAKDRVLVKVSERIGISYEFIDASERLNGAIFKEEDRRFFEIVRNLVLGTIIIASILILMSGTKEKIIRKAMTKKRVVEVVIPEEVVKKKEVKPKVKLPEKLKPKVKPRPKLKPKPKVKVRPQSKPKPKVKPRPKPKPKPKAKVKPQSKPKSKSVARRRPKKRTKTPTPLRAENKSRVKPRRRSRAPKEQKTTNTALAAFASFNKINTFKPDQVSKNFKIDRTASKRVDVSSGQKLIKSLNKENLGRGGGSSSRSALNQVSADFSGKNLSQKTGNRAVKGAVVGAPSLQNEPNRQQGLSPAQVMAVVNRHLSTVQRCYERALFDQPNLAGRVEYEWTITPGGKVQSVGIRRSEASGDKKLNNCVKGVFRKMNFPAATNGQSTVTSIGFPFGKL